MNPIKKVRLSESIIDVIKQMIAKEGFKPGEKFYSENVLTKKLGVSRSSIREALKMLEASGQVTIRHGKGVFIEEPRGRQFNAFTAWLKNNEQSINDNFEVRLIIEPKVASLAAKNADANDTIQLEDTCRLFEKYAAENNIEEVIRCDRQFHRLLAESSKNNTLYVLMKSMTTTLPNGWISSLYTPGRIEKTIGEHRAILADVKRHRIAAAEEAMTRHLVNAHRDVQAQMLRDTEEQTDGGQDHHPD